MAVSAKLTLNSTLKPLLGSTYQFNREPKFGLEFGPELPNLP